MPSKMEKQNKTKQNKTKNNTKDLRTRHRHRAKLLSVEIVVSWFELFTHLQKALLGSRAL